MTMIRYALSFTLLLTAGSVMAADDALDGAKLYTDKGCLTCHGDATKDPLAPNYPKLHGQAEQYLVDKLKGYKAGEIKGNQAAIMTPMVAAVSEEEMVAISAYLAGESMCSPEADEEKSEG